jgi:chromosome partitioning protein
MASTEVLIPVDAGFFPLIGLGLLRRTIDRVKGANPKLRISGVIPTMFDRTALAADTLQELEAAFGELILPGIPRRVAIGEAHAAGKDIFAYDTRGDGTKAYAALLEEVLKRG